MYVHAPSNITDYDALSARPVVARLSPLSMRARKEGHEAGSRVADSAVLLTSDGNAPCARVLTPTQGLLRRVK